MVPVAYVVGPGLTRGGESRSFEVGFAVLTARGFLYVVG